MNMKKIALVISAQARGQAPFARSALRVVPTNGA